MFKRRMSFVLAVLMALTMMTAMMLPTSAAQTISIKDDFAAWTDGDVGAMGLPREFNIESSDHARIKYSFGKGYLCPDGGGVTASIVYKLELGEGETLSALNMTVKAHFASREGYSEDWTETPKGVVSVSSDGLTYTDAATFDGELVAGSLGQNDFNTLSPKTYNADLKAAAGNAQTIYIKLSWMVYDYPMYSSVHSVEITGSTTGGSAPESSEPESSAPEASSEPEVSSEPESSEPEVTSVPETSTPEASTAPETSTPAAESSAADVSTPDDTETDGDGGNGLVIVIVIVVVVLLLAAAGGIVFLLYKKGMLKAK